MRTFKHFNQSSKCPICGTNEDKECVLIPITGTTEENIAEAEQFHLECIDLWYDKEENIIHQKFGGEK